MRDTAKVKEYNLEFVRSIFRSGGSFTKQQIAMSSGLSIATSNTILNELEDKGEIFGKKKSTFEVGRNAKVYRMNEDFSYVICVCFKISGGIKTLSCYIMNLMGSLKEEHTETLERIDYSVIHEWVGRFVHQYANIRCISIGTPGVASQGCIRHCDVAELINEPIADKLYHTYGIPVRLECDMHLMIYGFYKKECQEQETASIAIFPPHVLPGVGSVVEGKIITGFSKFAGEAGFLPYGYSKEKLLRLCNQKEFLPIAVKIVASLIALINPSKIILTGELISETVPEKIYGLCLEYIPKEHMPEIMYIEDITSYYLEGLFTIAM